MALPFNFMKGICPIFIPAGNTKVKLLIFLISKTCLLLTPGCTKGTVAWTSKPNLANLIFHLNILQSHPVKLY